MNKKKTTTTTSEHVKTSVPLALENKRLQRSTCVSNTQVQKNYIGKITLGDRGGTQLGDPKGLNWIRRVFTTATAVPRDSFPGRTQKYETSKFIRRNKKIKSIDRSTPFRWGFDWRLKFPQEKSWKTPMPKSNSSFAKFLLINNRFV